MLSLTPRFSEVSVSANGAISSSAWGIAPGFGANYNQALKARLKRIGNESRLQRCGSWAD
jgi:hypothetical protein